MVNNFWFMQTSASQSYYALTKSYRRFSATKVFAIAGLDVEAIGSKSLISFGSGLSASRMKRRKFLFNAL
jgi:hypothetical protein